MGLLSGLFGGKKETLESSTEPWKPAIPYLTDTMSGLRNWLSNAKNTGYISPTGDLEQAYDPVMNALAQLSPELQTRALQGEAQAKQRLGQASDVYSDATLGRLGINTQDILSEAAPLLNDPNLTAQIQAATRDDVRNLVENQLPMQQRSAMASGNVGSSRNAIKQGLLQRGAEDRVADVAAKMRSDSRRNALNMALNTLNQQNRMKMLGAENQQQAASQTMKDATIMPMLLQGAIEPQKDIAALVELLQRQRQADRIGARDFAGDLYKGVAPIYMGMGGLGSKSTQQQMGPSLFQQALSAGKAAGEMYANLNK